jgi:hypothetical protein
MIASGAPPELEPPSRAPGTRKMFNQSPRIMFETLARYAGIAILFDPEYQPMKTASFEAGDATLEEALDHLALVTRSYWKTVSRNTVFVTGESPGKLLRRLFSGESVQRDSGGLIVAIAPHIVRRPISIRTTCAPSPPAAPEP